MMCNFLYNGLLFCKASPHVDRVLDRVLIEQQECLGGD